MLACPSTSKYKTSKMQDSVGTARSENLFESHAGLCFSRVSFVIHDHHAGVKGSQVQILSARLESLVRKRENGPRNFGSGARFAVLASMLVRIEQLHQAGILLDFVRLQRQQSVCRFSSVVNPPRETGVM